MSETQAFWSRRARLILWGCGAAVVVAIIVGALARRDNVRYQGRLLSEYFVDLVRASGSSSYVAATNAVLSVGQRGLPVILRQVKHSTPWRVRFYLATKDWLPNRVVAFLSRRIDPYYYVNRREGAIRAIGVLGTNALPIIDQLVALYGCLTRPERYLLANELLKMGPDVLPRMTGYLNDSRLDVRRDIAEFVGRLGKDGVTAAPALISGLDGADEKYFQATAQALCQIGPGADAEIDTMLKSPNAEHRRAIVASLATFGTGDPNNQERLFECLGDPDFDVRLTATAGLVRAHKYDRLFNRRGNDALNPQNKTAAVDAQLLRMLKVLNDGLRSANPTNQLAAAEGLVDMDQIDTNLVAALRDLQTTFATNIMQKSQVRWLLQSAEDRMNRRSLIERALRNQTH